MKVTCTNVWYTSWTFFCHSLLSYGHASKNGYTPNFYSYLTLLLSSIEVMVCHLWSVCRPLKILMLRLTVCPLRVVDVISERKKTLQPLPWYIKSVPWSWTPGKLFPWCNITYVFVTDLPSSLMMCGRRYAKSINWASVSSEEWEVLLLIN